jgi:nucleoside-diphosphate-sugar epimerase
VLCFQGGWIVVHLIARGEDPKNIRVIDLRKPTRKDLTTGPARDATFLEIDISDEQKVNDAFALPWPSTSETVPPLTVIHTAGNIRFYERAKVLVPRSAKVNVTGLRHVLNAAVAFGTSYFIYTSSASLAVRRVRYWLWPWQSLPDYFIQVLDDKDTSIPKDHEDFFSNYSYTKKLGEQLVREHDKATVKGIHRMRTGCLRPGNGVYGPGVLCMVALLFDK